MGGGGVVFCFAILLSPLSCFSLATGLIYGGEQSEKLVEKPSRCPRLRKWFENVGIAGAVR